VNVSTLHLPSFHRHSSVGEHRAVFLALLGLEPLAERTIQRVDREPSPGRGGIPAGAAARAEQEP
jgi:hypothetical protein